MVTIIIFIIELGVTQVDGDWVKVTFITHGFKIRFCLIDG